MPNWTFFSIPIPLWALITAAAVILSLLVLIVWSRVSRRVFRRRFRRVVAKPELAGPLIRDRYSKVNLLSKSRLIEKIVRKEGSAVLPLIGMDELWTESMMRYRRRKDLERVLRYVPSKGLFQAFLLILDKKDLAPLLFSWLEKSGDFLPVRRLALAGRGEVFDGSLALEAFREHLPEIREMTGDPEWPARYFAVKILLHDNDEERSRRAIWDAFSDAHPLVRKTVAREIRTEKREELYDKLKALVLSDPVYEVRQEAWTRLLADFADRSSIALEGLSDSQILHVLELLREDNKPDENLALRILESDNLEHRFAAARYLAKTGALDRLCLSVDLGNREALDKALGLLEKASEVNVTGFLGVIERTQNPAVLLVCSRILERSGERELIPALARKVFDLERGKEVLSEVYVSTVSTVSKRGDDDALSELLRELDRRRQQEVYLTAMLEAIPPRADRIFRKTLLELLKEPGCKAPDDLRATLKRVLSGSILPELFTILLADRSHFPHPVRIQALKLLGEMQQPYCIQSLLENLPILPVTEAKDFIKILSAYPKGNFVPRVESLLESADAKIRSALISVLPATDDKNFIKSIRKSLKDADPDVRVACVYALTEFEDNRTLNQALDMVRDPVERVREAVAEAIGKFGSKEAIAGLKDVLFDENEVDSVKAAAVKGLGVSTKPEAVDHLTAALEEGKGDAEKIRKALAGKLERASFSRLVEHFKDGSPELRSSLSEVFKAMGLAGEEVMVGILREDIPSLKPFLAEILETTGHVEVRIRGLSHRDPAVRRESAAFLSMVGTLSAFRGMVLAARDPDEEVRVQVIRALEKLESKEGKVILAELEKDPDRRVRMYTAWALERLKSKAL